MGAAPPWRGASVEECGEAVAAPGRTEKAGTGRGRLWGAAVLALLVVGYAAGKVERALFRLGLRTEPAVYGAVETRYEGKAVLLRRETVVPAPAAGRVTLLVGEGRHVRAGDLIVELGDAGAAGRAAQALEEIDRRLASLEAAYRGEEQQVRAARRELEQRLAKEEQQLSEALAKADREAALAAEARRDQAAHELARLEATLLEFSRAYEAERERLLEQRRAAVPPRPEGAVLVRAPEAGVVSFSLDGYEADLVPGAELAAVFERGPASERRIQDGLVVAGGEPLFRVVETHEVEVAVRLRGPGLEKGSKVTLEFRGIPERKFTGTLVESRPAGNELWGRVRLDGFDSSLVYRREMDVVLTTGRKQGVVVPAAAVVEAEGRQGVYVVLGDQILFRPVRVLGGDGRRAVLDGVPEGARVVLNPGRLARR